MEGLEKLFKGSKCVNLINRVVLISLVGFPTLAQLKINIPSLLLVTEEFTFYAMWFSKIILLYLNFRQRRKSDYANL